MNKLLLLSALAGLAGVALGAFGAHLLKPSLLGKGTYDTWNTAVLYHLVHAAASAAIALITASFIGKNTRLLRATACLWLLGILLFSGSLYALALGGPRLLGPITPVGGLAFLAGWATLAVAAGSVDRK